MMKCRIFDGVLQPGSHIHGVTKKKIYSVTDSWQLSRLHIAYCIFELVKIIGNGMKKYWKTRRKIQLDFLLKLVSRCVLASL